MSDECLMKGKSGSLYFGEYQAGMRKFTLAGKANGFYPHLLCLLNNGHLEITGTYDC